MAALDPGEKHTLFTSWARSQGIEINGVAPAQFVDRGMGIVAAKDLKKGDCLVHVPTHALISVAQDSIYKMTFPTKVSVHARIATYFSLLSQEKESPYSLWQDVWPSEEDFRDIMPIYWAKELQELLPPAAKTMLSTQKSNLEKDYQTIHPLCPTITRSTFTYHWITTNTRVFYWLYPNLPAHSPRLPKKSRANLTADDCYAMCPFMDYFNHASTGCIPTSDAKGYSVHADRDYKAGEEVCVTYGPHSNDFLLVEYGFILVANECDSVPLDHLVVPRLSAAQVETLKGDGFYGNYTLSPDSTPPVCHRTHGVARLLTLPERRYSAFVGGTDEGSADQGKVDAFLVGLLVEFEREIIEILDEVEGQGEKAEVLVRRWKQVQGIVRRGVKRLSGEIV
ncbi:unnamed protein product [Periconia digitata]|uniref:SET domain-containing protein n=1 Tax=Periconia digitata TaxID=1303443 RepID=A0A9W4UKA2_9PLEO|nr:unnamed protein product [Periconia digitata]